MPVLSGLDFANNTFWGRQTVQNIDIQPLTKPELALESALTETISNISINENLSVLLIGGYLLLIGYFLIKLLRAWQRTQAVKNKAFFSEPSEKILEVVAECRTFLDVKNVQIVYSSEIALPVTLGAFCPLVILPESLASETDRDILLSAIGHELVHVKRRDYLLNLLCEIVCLPILFHPITRLLKRRIKETRELRCDELVTDKLLKPTVYAQSLVQLASSAIGLGRTATLTIGINDGDALENRIMKIVKKPKIKAYQKTLLLISAVTLFGTAFVVAKSFSLNPVVATQPLTETEQNESVEVEEKKAADDKNILTKQAKVSMPQAIEIATAFQPGTVIENEFGDAKDEGLVYKILIRNQNSIKAQVTRVTINALDGRIIKTWRGIRK